MNSCIIMVDYQEGFITTTTNHVLSRVEELLDKDIFKHVIASQFYNEINSPFVTIMKWYGLMSKEEIEIYKPILPKAEIIIKKNTYTCVNDKLLRFLKEREINTVWLCGIDTDCCVLKTAVDLFENNIRPIVLSDYCASTGGEESHEAALTVLERFIGKQNIIHGEITKDRVLDIEKYD